MFLAKPDVVGPHTFTDHPNLFGVGRYPQKKNLPKKIFKGQCLNCVSRACTTKEKRIYYYTLRNLKQAHA